MQEDLRALAEVLDAGGAEQDPAGEKGEAHVGAEGAMGDGETKSEDPEQEQAALAPLRRRAPGARRQQHQTAKAEVCRIEEVSATDAQRVLAADGKNAGQRRHPPGAGAEQQRKAEAGDDWREQAGVRKIEESLAGELGPEARGEQ